MSIAALNRKYFDAISDSYDQKPWWGAVNKQVSDTLRSQLDWIGIPFVSTDSSSDGKQVRLLDYACGTGFMTRTFGPYVTKTMGIDVSPNMVTTYNTRAREAGIPETCVYAASGDLFDKSDPAPAAFSGAEWQGFDLATVGFGFHHFEDVVFAAQQLKGRVRPGGAVVITDFVEGGDLKVDENGEPIPGSEGNHAIHKHGHGHDHGHGHGHGHVHGHGHDHDNGHAHAHQHNHEHEHKHDDHQHASPDDRNHDTDDSSPEFLKKMTDSVVVPHFTLDGVREIFIKAGFVDVDVFAAKEKSYMEFGGKKLYRTVLYAKARRPFEEEKSEL